MSPLYQYLNDGISFQSKDALNLRMIYFPLCGSSADSIKSSITPYLSGDIKTDKYHYITKPASREDLRNNLRDFFVSVKGKGVFSLTNESAKDSATVEAGQLYHQLTRTHKVCGLEMRALNFVPVSGENAELMRVSIKNISKKTIQLTPTSCVALFGRSLANKHDHEHVTALLHRIKQVSSGVSLEHVMSFNEEGHQSNDAVYFVFGCDDKGANPSGSFPTLENFYGDGGNVSSPQAVLENHSPRKLSKDECSGKEAVGALRFANVTLKPGQTKEYLIVIGVAKSETEALSTFHQFDSVKKFDAALERNKKFWYDKSHTIDFYTGNKNFNSWLKWVSIQPVLRRIFGCSFLPDHDYGKGGKGWRDIWQDLLSLIFIEPDHVRESLLNYFAGVRIDGTNATIIGSRSDEFIADRNAITRVWMDHGLWPLTTILLYIHQTGETEAMFHKTSYFRDPQIFRTFHKDASWTSHAGQKLKDKHGRVYEGTILEHILIQHLVQFFNVGEHNLIRLENADWNDALDMAFHRGESAAFSSFYAGNLLEIANFLEYILKEKNVKEITLSREVLTLLDSISGGDVDYNNIEQKKKLLFERYFPSVQPVLSGEQVPVGIEKVISDLRKKGEWLFGHIRSQEKVEVKESGKKYRFFNGYYDNKAARVEGKKNNGVWMTLTGQVFSIMSGMANDSEVKETIASVNKFLKDKKLKGIRLNTDFGLKHNLDLGRGFGFAYGTKENGAFFSHMNVMYAYGLYKRGFVKDAREVIHSIFNMAQDTKRSKIYPGIPEYFDSLGQGMYHYLTGSASWLILTELTQSFGVCGHYGDLVISPKLIKEDFDSSGKASVSCQFAGKRVEVVYVNAKKRDFGQYSIKEVLLNDQPVVFDPFNKASIKFKRSQIASFPDTSKLTVILF